MRQVPVDIKPFDANLDESEIMNSWNGKGIQVPSKIQLNAIEVYSPGGKQDEPSSTEESEE